MLFSRQLSPDQIENYNKCTGVCVCARVVWDPGHVLKRTGSDSSTTGGCLCHYESGVRHLLGEPEVEDERWGARGPPTYLLHTIPSDTEIPCYDENRGAQGDLFNTVRVLPGL